MIPHIQSSKLALSLSCYRLPEAYREFSGTISRVDADQDLKYYSETSGAAMGYTWPEFEVSGRILHTLLIKNCVLNISFTGICAWNLQPSQGFFTRQYSDG